MLTKQKLFVISRRGQIVCLIVGLVALALLGASLWAAVDNKLGMSTLEADIFGSVNNTSDSYVAMAKLVTFFGSISALLLLGIMATLLKRYMLAWWLALSSFLTIGGGMALKLLVDRPRPSGLGVDPIVRSIEQSSGFPSIHTALATVMALTLFYYFPKSIRWVVVGLWIIAVAWSRVYLGVHSPLDLIGGLAVGLIIFSGLRLLPLSIRQKLKLAAVDSTNQEPQTSGPKNQPQSLKKH